ncbi:protein FAM156A/FAM156B-like [Ctenodactylus gundi]
MDPLQKWNPGFISGSSQMPAAETSQEGTAAPQPSSSGQLKLSLTDLIARPATNTPVPLPGGLFQQQYREENIPQEQYWEKLGLPQRKKALLGHMRRRHRDHMAPYPVEREIRVPPSRDRAQNQFRCECRYCQGHRPSVSGVAGERNRGSNPSSWETLLQGLSGLTLNLGTNPPSVLGEGAQHQQQQEEKVQPERQEESKKRFQKLLKHWLEDN